MPILVLVSRNERFSYNLQLSAPLVIYRDVLVVCAEIWHNVCMCIYVSIFVCMYLRIYVRMHVCMYVYMYVRTCVCVCVCVCMHVCMCNVMETKTIIIEFHLHFNKQLTKGLECDD